jgi:chromosome segregation protein
MDIQELLSDTGVGRTLHTLIGQGHLDDVLEARPEERRLYVEEAAGIAKHRRRRERAQRKLAGLEGDLLRLQDLAGELRRQLKPLKQQAELAARHEALSKEAQELARHVAAARLRDLQAERDRRRPDWQRGEARQAAARERLTELDQEIARLDRARLDAEEARRDMEERHDSLVAAKSAAEAALREAIGREGHARERLAEATNRSGRLFALREELARTEALVQEAEAALAGREPDLLRAEEAFRAAEAARRDAEEERRRLAEESATRRAEAEAVKEALASHGEERDRLAARMSEVGSRLVRATSRADELESEIERLDGLEAPLAAEQQTLKHEQEALGRRVASLEAEEKGLLARQQVVESRREELSESPGAAFIRRQGARPIGLLRELIEAPPDLETALKAALGPFADSVVYGTAEEALNDAATGGGRGVILAVGAPAGSAPALDAAGGDRLIERLRVDIRARLLVERLLGDVFLVRNLAEASSRRRVHPEAQFVTPEGAVVGPAFVRMPAELDARLEAIRRESAAIERDLAAVRRGLREARRRLAEIAERSSVLGTELEGLDRQITTAAEELGRAQAEAASLESEHQMLKERAGAVGVSVELATARLARAPAALVELPVLPSMPEPPVHLRVEVEAIRRERARLESAARQTRQDVEHLAAEDPVALRGELQSAELDRTAAEAALERVEEEIGPAASAYRSASQAAGQAVASVADANRAWREAAAELERIRQEHEQEDRSRADLERRIADAERLVAEGHGADPAQAVASLGPEDTIASLERRADLVARRLGLLGRVNLLAVGELETLQERHDFLVRELDDVRAARRDLERIVDDVDRQMALMFELAFRDVAREFSDLFAQLFPGGEGRLTLLDPADPLGSGIEVEARPGRKKVRRLSLLSGGERSLAALAFLFAIFRARPSPFYLMDEVEAALDDVNLHRFLGCVKDFARDSQIILVTHQKRTMETADVLYGVSMGKAGASAIISQRLAEVDATQP